MPTLDFKGKQFIYAHHLGVPYRTLEADIKKSVPGDKAADGNMIIQGDNLDALKALMPRYAGRVNCVYIDPPYNTGNEGWCYNDDVNSPLMKRWLADKGEIEGEDLERHDKWLCMMWPRLQLLRELLAEDGIIFVSIDDNEVHRLRLLMDEIFGEESFIASFVWEGTSMHTAKFVAVTHDYILCYAKNRETLEAAKKRWRVRKEGLDKIYRQEESLRKQHGDDYATMSAELNTWYAELKKSDSAWQHRHYNHIDKNGVYCASNISPPGGGGGAYDIAHPATGEVVKRPRRGWLYAQESRMREAIAKDLVCFGPDENTVPTIKMYLRNTESQIMNGVIYQDRRGASISLRAILEKDAFPFPKDHRVLMKIFEAVTDKDSIVLDSFAGSGTTAHAVLALNKKDGGNRKFILAQCDEYDPKTKRMTNICHSVTAKRVRRVIKGVETAKDEALKNGLGGGFTFCTLGKDVDMEEMLGGGLPTYETLARYVAYTSLGASLEKIEKGKDWLFGEISGRRLHLIYEPDRKFLVSPDSALSAKLAEKIQKAAAGRPALVFAPWKFMSQAELTPMRITFCQLPYAMYRLFGDSADVS